MKFCKRCLMPDTRPGSVFDSEGICQACHNYDKRKNIDWKARRKELEELCGKYRRNDGYYDCVIAVSGGKDSHFLVHTMKMEMGMNPLLVTVGDPFTKTQAGLHNYRNLGDIMGCDHILFDMSIDVFRRIARTLFEERLEPMRFIEAGLYIIPYKMAVKFGIPLVVWGENPTYEYGEKGEQSYSAMEFIEGAFKTADVDNWLKKGISTKELNAVMPPTEEELKRTSPFGIFMSYFSSWSSVKHLEIARRYGFRDLAHEWKREGYVEDFEQIDSVAYILNIWLKYPKFGFQRISDIVSRRVREGRISLNDASKLIMENDNKLDQRALDDFLKFMGYTPKQYWDIVERFRNKEIFTNADGVWKLKKTVMDM